MARLLIIVGIAVVVIGLILQFAPWLLNWFGKLPGDINYESENTRVYIPITSMIIVSLLLSLLLYLGSPVKPNQLAQLD
jgi:Protein of unknown function (DUF2905)